MLSRVMKDAAAGVNAQAWRGPSALADQVGKAAKQWDDGGGTRRLWDKDASLWTGADEAKWLGWLGAIDAGRALLPTLGEIAAGVRRDGFTHALLLGIERFMSMARAVTNMIGNGVAGIVGALEAMMARVDSTDTLATIDVPTLIVVGDEDVLTPPSEAEILHEAIRGSRLEVIEHAGHVSNMERPAAFNHVLSEFLASLEYV